MMPPKMAIHTIHVRGGTRNSPPFFPSSLFRLSSAMCSYNWAPCYHEPSITATQDLAALPLPNQASLRPRPDLKALADALVFHPKHLTFCRCAHHQFMPPLARNFLVCEPILQFHGAAHPDWPEAVARFPVAQYNLRANFVRIEDLAPK